ncbi:MAG: ribonuclease P protein component [Evtepia gabavorous]
MKYTVSLKENRVFRRLYAKGRSAVSPTMVLYCRKNGRRETELGLTTGTKLGHAVVRNRVRRRLPGNTHRSAGAPPAPPLATILSSWPGFGRFTAGTPNWNGIFSAWQKSSSFSPPKVLMRRERSHEGCSVSSG